MSLHLHSVTFDCDDPAALASFWAGVTGYEQGGSSPFFAELRGDGSVGPRMMFIKVPEGKTAKNRCHLDLGTVDLDEEVTRVVGLGAAVVGRHEEWGVTWATLRDPEGNEFCIGRHASPEREAGEP
jgi:predicted enzyme related to lactoylglutathione lyase